MPNKNSELVVLLNPYVVHTLECIDSTQVSSWVWLSTVTGTVKGVPGGCHARHLLAVSVSIPPLLAESCFHPSQLVSACGER